MQQSRDQSATFTLAFSSLSSHTHQSPSYTLPTVVCAVVTWIKGFSGHAVPVLSLSPADNRHLTSCLSSPLHSPDPGDPGNQRERPPDGRHADGEGRQRQLGGGLQSPDHHAPPHGAWQRGGSWHNVYTHTHTLHPDHILMFVAAFRVWAKAVRRGERILKFHWSRHLILPDPLTTTVWSWSW